MKLLRWVGLIWLSMLALICSANLYGYTQADKFTAFGLDICDGQPCFMGIIPSVTQWNDAPAHLKGYEIHNDDLKTGIWILLTEHIEINMVRYPDNTPFVTLITIDNSTPTELMTSTFPPVGEFIAKYGAPCWVLFDNHDQSPSNKYLSHLVYPRMTVDLDNTKPFVPTAAVSTVQIMSSDWTIDHHDLCSTEPNVEQGLPWVGFASIDRYWAELAAKQDQH